MNRSDAILKIRKLQNTHGRLPNEIEATRIIIKRLIERFNIGTPELKQDNNIPQPAYAITSRFTSISNVYKWLSLMVNLFIPHWVMLIIANTVVFEIMKVPSPIDNIFIKIPYGIIFVEVIVFNAAFFLLAGGVILFHVIRNFKLFFNWALTRLKPTILFHYRLNHRR